MNYNIRLQKLQDILKQLSYDGLLVEDPVNLYYMTGISLTSGFLLVHPLGAHLVVDNRYYELCQKSSPFPVLLSEKNSLNNILRSSEFGSPKAIAFDSENTSYKRYQELENLMEEIGACSLLPATNPIKKLRMIKDPEELAILREAADLGSQGFDYVCTLLKEGVTEAQVACELEIFWKRRGSQSVAFDPIIAFGANSSMPHYRAGNTSLKRGMAVLIDIGVNLNHYHSDMSRVVFFGEPDGKLQEIYRIVEKAQKDAIQFCRPGLLVSELDQFARSYIAGLGYGENFSHALGHGIGLEIHETPIIRNKTPFKETSLEAGMVITIEPGIYLPDKGGIRIEDMILITPEGIENLTKRSTEIFIID